MKLTPQELEYAKILSDPVLFAKHFFNWEARWYQVEMLRSKSLRKVARAGRRIGKCLHKDSRVMTSSGPVPVEKLFSMKHRPSILTFDEKTQKILETSRYIVMNNGVKPVYKLTTKSGRTNIVTGNHPFLVIGEEGSLDWKELDELEVGSRIAAPSSYKGLIKGKSVGSRKARLLGYLCGDEGTNYTNAIRFSNIDDGILNDLRDILSDYNCLLNDIGNGSGDYSIVSIAGPNEVVNLSRKHGIQEKLSIEKRVPDVVMAGTESDIANFLGAYWDCDGWVSSSKKTYDSAHKTPAVEVGCCSGSERLARDIHHLLLRLGIISLLKQKKVIYNEEPRIYWTVCIHDIESITKFANTIPLVSKKKEDMQSALSILADKNPNGNRYMETIPREVWTYIKNVQGGLGLTNQQVCEDGGPHARLRTEYSISRDKVLTYSNNLGRDKYLEALANSDILWDEIVSIEYEGDSETYDLTVSETHTLIADDIISHNTDVICIHAVWYAYTNKNAALLIATPYENQVNLIFSRMREFLKDCPEISGSIVINRRNPNYIEFGNGSRIQGFTAGTKSGAEGGSIRGQKADWIYLDKHAS